MSIVKTATPGLGFDVDQQLFPNEAADFKNSGYNYCIRYVPRTPALVKGNLTAVEMGVILEAGLGLAVVQHVPEDNWSPNGALGETYGSYAAQYATGIGYPKGAMIFLDLEMVSPNAAVQDIEDYCHLWFGHVGSYGYVAGLYVGWQTGLSPQQLHNLPFSHYWKGYNADIPIPTRGYQIIQHTQKTLNGVTFDPNTIQADELGDLPIFLSPS